MDLECTGRCKKGNKIIGYRLTDGRQEITIPAEELKFAMMDGTMHVSNLKLTSDCRIILVNNTKPSKMKYSIAEVVSIENEIKLLKEDDPKYKPTDEDYKRWESQNNKGYIYYSVDEIGNKDVGIMKLKETALDEYMCYCNQSDKYKLKFRKQGTVTVDKHTKRVFIQAYNDSWYTHDWVLILKK